MITSINNANLPDVKREMSRMLQESTSDPTVRKLAESIIEGANTDQISAIYEFVKDNYGYLPDPYDKELFIHPRKFAQDYFDDISRRGDCDDQSLLVASLLSSIGYKVRIALLNTAGVEFDHAVAQVWVEELGWVNLDTTSKRPQGWLIDFQEAVYVA